MALAEPVHSPEPTRAQPSRVGSTKTSLRLLATELVNDYLRGRLGGPVDESLGPEARTFLLECLLARCPGFSTRDYRTALGSGLSARGRQGLAAARR